MSDEPKKRSRGWIGWTLVALFVGYPVSAVLFGIADWWLCQHGNEGLNALSVIFYPIFWAIAQFGD
jgi:hypothetical protein